MKITIWNVNGLRAAFRHQASAWWEVENPDLLCLQEIRVHPDQLTNQQLASFQDRTAVWHPAKRPGYSGVAAFCSQPPLKIIKGLGMDRFDREGRLIQLEYPSFWIYNLYVPNGRRDLSRLGYKLSFYQALLDHCQQRREDGKGLILCGDFNTAHQPIDLRNPDQNQKNTGFLPEERAWIDRFLEHGFVDGFRRLHPDQESYTWWTYRYQARERDIGWRLDYFLLTRALMSRVNDLTIHTGVMGSDHCPVTLDIEE